MGASHASWWGKAQSDLEAARKLKAVGLSAQAYQLAGQAVEFSLKAIAIQRKNLGEWPASQKGPEWHSLKRILEYAGLRGDLGQMQITEPLRYANWLVVRDWDSNGRFPGSLPSKDDLNELFIAVCHQREGVMVWLHKLYHTN